VNRLFVVFFLSFLCIRCLKAKTQKPPLCTLSCGRMRSPFG
jgi:hypothetical protein